MALPDNIQKGKDIQRLFGTSFDEKKAIGDFLEHLYTKISHTVTGFDDTWKAEHSLIEANIAIEEFKLVREQITTIRNG